MSSLKRTFVREDVDDERVMPIPVYAYKRDPLIPFVQAPSSGTDLYFPPKMPSRYEIQREVERSQKRKKDEDKRKKEDKLLPPGLTRDQVEAGKSSEMEAERACMVVIDCFIGDILSAQMDSDTRFIKSDGTRWKIYGRPLGHSGRVSVCITSIRHARASSRTLSVFQREYIAHDNGSELRVLYGLADGMLIEKDSPCVLRMESSCDNLQANLNNTNYMVLTGKVTSHEKLGVNKLWLMQARNITKEEYEFHKIQALFARKWWDNERKK